MWEVPHPVRDRRLSRSERELAPTGLLTSADFIVRPWVRDRFVGAPRRGDTAGYRGSPCCPQHGRGDLLMAPTFSSRTLRPSGLPKPLTSRNLRPSVVFKELMTRWLATGRRRGQAMVEAMVVAGVLLTVLVGLGFLVSAVLDNAYRGLVLISSEYP